MQSTGTTFSTEANDMISIDKIWITDEEVFIQCKDGRVASERFSDYPRLKYASAEKLRNFSTDAFGIHWNDLDEDLSFEGFFKEKNQTPLYRIFTEHPELNASAVARRMGIAQSLFAQYISGTKKPSAERMDIILETIRTIGKELSEI